MCRVTLNMPLGIYKRPYSVITQYWHAQYSLSFCLSLKFSAALYPDKAHNAVADWIISLMYLTAGVF